MRLLLCVVLLRVILFFLFFFFFVYFVFFFLSFFFFFFQAEDGIRDLVRSRGLGDVYKRQVVVISILVSATSGNWRIGSWKNACRPASRMSRLTTCLLYTSDAAEERSSVDLGGRRIIKKKKRVIHERMV